jgi:hypothetical protein
MDGAKTAANGLVGPKAAANGTTAGGMAEPKTTARGMNEQPLLDEAEARVRRAAADIHRFVAGQTLNSRQRINLLTRARPLVDFFRDLLPPETPEAFARAHDFAQAQHHEYVARHAGESKKLAEARRHYLLAARLYWSAGHADKARECDEAAHEIGLKTRVPWISISISAKLPPEAPAEI